MVEVVFWLSVLCGFAALLRRENGRWGIGNPTAIPLLVSAMFGVALEYLQTPFNPFFCMTVDGVVMVIIWRNVILNHDDLPMNDGVITALFPVAWVFYAMSDGWLRLWGTTAVVATQFLLTLPWHQIGQSLRGFRASKKHDDTGLNYWGESSAAYSKLHR